MSSKKPNTARSSSAIYKDSVVKWWINKNKYTKTNSKYSQPFEYRADFCLPQTRQSISRNADNGPFKIKPSTPIAPLLLQNDFQKNNKSKDESPEFNLYGDQKCKTDRSHYDVLHSTVPPMTALPAFPRRKNIQRLQCHPQRPSTANSALRTANDMDHDEDDGDRHKYHELFGNEKPFIPNSDLYLTPRCIVRERAQKEDVNTHNLSLPTAVKMVLSMRQMREKIIWKSRKTKKRPKIPSFEKVKVAKKHKKAITKKEEIKRAIALVAAPLQRKRFEHYKKLQKIVGKRILKSMITIYDMIDINGDGNLDIAEVVKFNIFLDPYSDLKSVHEDCRLLFTLADDDADNQITRMEWLNGWCQSVKRVGNADHLNRFIEQFKEREIRHSQMVMAWQFTVQMLQRILRWARRHSVDKATKKATKYEL